MHRNTNKDTHTTTQTNRHTEIQTQTNRHIHRQTDTDIQTHIHTDTYMNTYTHTHRLTYTQPQYTAGPIMRTPDKHAPHFSIGKEQ